MCSHRHDVDVDQAPKLAKDADAEDTTLEEGTPRRLPSSKVHQEPGARRWLPLVLIALSSVGFSVQALMVRELTLQGLGTFQILMVRGLCQACGCCLALLWAQKPSAEWLGSSSLERKALFARGLVGYGGICFGFLAISLMHLADSQIVAQTAPIFSAAFARIFLKEPWHCSEFFSAGAGIAGVAFIAKPQVLLHPDEPEALAPGVAELGGVGPVHSRQLVGVFFGLLSAVAAGCAYVIIRFLGTGAKVHWASVLLAQASGQLALSPLGWRLSGQQLRLFTRSELVMNVAVGALGFFSQCAMTKGMQKEKSATASLVRQSLCPCFALLWQLCFFPEDRLGWTSLAGFATILLGLAVTVTCKAFREQRAAGETYGHLASEKNEEDSPPASTDCCAVVAEAADAQAVYGKRSFFDEAPGETRERQMIHELQGDGFSQKQAELALAKVNWSSVQAARDVLLDVKYVLGQAPNGAVAGGNGAVSAAGTPGVAEKGQLRA